MGNIKVELLLLGTRDRSVLSKAYLANPSYLRYNKRGFEYDSYGSNDNQHLYVISKDSIDINLDIIDPIEYNNKWYIQKNGIREILASTNPLYIKGERIPMISNSFIEKYTIDQKDAFMEVESLCSSDLNKNCQHICSEFRIRLNNNEVILGVK